MNGEPNIQDPIVPGGPEVGSKEAGPRLGTEQITKEMESLKQKLDTMKTEFDRFKNEQGIRVVEFLGIFTALLSFIALSSNVLLSNLTVRGVMLLLPSFALCLVIFVVGIKILIVDKNIVRTCFLILTLLILVICSYLFFKYEASKQKFVKADKVEMHTTSETISKSKK